MSEKNSFTSRLLLLEWFTKAASSFSSCCQSDQGMTWPFREALVECSPSSLTWAGVSRHWQRVILSKQMPFSKLWVPLYFVTQFLIYFETFSYKTWKMRCTRKKLLTDVVNSGESQLVLYLEKRMYQRKQGWSHMCLPFHFRSNGCVESLILMEISAGFYTVVFH